MNKIVTNLLFLVKDDQVLLALKKRGFGVNRFNGVGGKVEQNESIEQAMIRESIEEISIKPINFEQVAILDFDEFYKGEPSLIRVHVFIATKWKGEPAESEEMAPKWFNINEIPFEKMWPDDIYWLNDVLNGKKLTAKFKLDENDQIISHEIKYTDNLI